MNWQGWIRSSPKAMTGQSIWLLFLEALAAFLAFISAWNVFDFGPQELLYSFLGLFLISTIDLVAFSGGFSNLLLDTIGHIISQKYHNRVIQHEAGHFLIAYLLAILPKGYTLSSFEAFQWESFRSCLETTILQQLNFRLNLPKPYVFMLRFLRAAQGSKKFENLAFFLIELCLVEYDALDFKPSLLCASAIYVARCTLHMAPAWTPLLRKHSHYEEAQIRNCAKMILRFHRAAKTAVLRVTYDKYMNNNSSKVASIKPLDRLPYT